MAKKFIKRNKETKEVAPLSQVADTSVNASAEKIKKILFNHLVATMSKDKKELTSEEIRDLQLLTRTLESLAKIDAQAVELKNETHQHIHVTPDMFKNMFPRGDDVEVSKSLKELARGNK